MLKAWFYDFIQFFLGAHKARKFLAVEVGVNAYNSVLDLGCGNGMLPAFLADTTGYLGVDLCSERIGVASGRWPEREFVVADIFDFFDSDCYGSRRFELWTSTRQRLAEDYLRQGRYSLSDIAFLLGYSDQSSFTRAFRRWTGMTPGQFQAS